MDSRRGVAYSPISHQSGAHETGTVVSYDSDKMTYRVQLDRGQGVNARLLNTGNLRGLRNDAKVLLVRTPTTQWIILGEVPVPNNNTFPDEEINSMLGRFPGARPQGISFRNKGNFENFGPDDQQILARSDSNSVRTVWYSVGGWLTEVGRKCFRFMNGVLGVIKDACFTYIMETPGITIASRSDGETKTAQVSIKIQPGLTEATAAQDNLELIMGADAVSSDGENPNKTTQGPCGETTPAIPGKPGIGFTLGTFISALADSQDGKIKLSLGENNIFTFDLTELQAILSDAQFTMGPDGILLQKGSETINLGVEELILTVSALTMTVAGSASLTATSIDLNGLTTIEGYQFVVDLINKLNQEWLTIFNGHTHLLAGIPTSGPPTPFTPVLPTGT